MNSFSLALRNLLRNRRRSLTTFLAMVMGAVAILLFGGYIQDMKYGLQTGYVHASGHLQIQRKDYFLYGTGNPAAYGIKDYENIISLVRNDPELADLIAVVTPTLQLGGIAGNVDAGVSRTVFATGMVVEDRNKMRQWNDYDIPLRASSLALTGTGADTAVVGEGVARVLQLCALIPGKECTAQSDGIDAGAPALPADIAGLSANQAARAAAGRGADNRIELLAANTYGAPNVARLNVIKAENQGIKELDDIYVALHLAQAQRLVYADEEPQVTAVVVQLRRTADIARATTRLNHLMETTFKDTPLEVVDFRTLNNSYVQITGMFDMIFAFISLLIGSIVLFTVGNTMNMAIAERTAEIGTLRAMGQRRGGIRRLFVSEGLFLGLIGSGLGVAVALTIAYAINNAGLTWLPPGQVEVTPLTVRVWGESGMLLGAALGLTLASVFSSWWPARRASRLVIVDALRHA